MRSIARRLFWTQLVASAILAAGVGALLYVRTKHSLSSQYDQSLLGKATSLAALMRMAPKGFEADFDRSALPEFSRYDHANYLQVAALDGNPVYRSMSLASHALTTRIGQEATDFQNVTLPDGTSGRAVVLRFTPSYDDDSYVPNPVPTVPLPAMLLTLAQSRRALDERLHSFATELILAAGSMSVGIVLVTFFTMKTSLAHLYRFGQTVERINVDHLNERVAENNLPVELTSISLRLNELLGRVEAGMHRERRFTADAAHELRTPIAELRTLAEVALRQPTDTATSTEFFGDALGIARQMESLVEALLALARGQSPQDASRMQSVDVSRLVSSVWDRLQPETAGRNLHANGRPQSDLRVHADPVILLSIFNNLLTNAVDHATFGGTLNWKLESAGKSVRFIVENSNDSLTPDDLNHIAEPFWRKSVSRTQGHHSGLGLSLVKAWAELINATLNFELSADGQLFRTVLSLQQAKRDAGMERLPGNV